MQGMDGGSGPNDLHALSPPQSVLSRSPSRYVPSILYSYINTSIYTNSIKYTSTFGMD